MREQEINSILGSLAVEMARITGKSETINAIKRKLKKIQTRIAEIAGVDEEARDNFYRVYLRVEDVFHGLEKRVEMLRSMLDVNRPDSSVLARVENESIKTIYSHEFFNFDALYAELLLDLKCIRKTLASDLKKNTDLIQKVTTKNKMIEPSAIDQGHEEMKRWVANAIQAQLFLFNPARFGRQVVRDVELQSQTEKKTNGL